MKRLSLGKPYVPDFRTAFRIVTERYSGDINGDITRFLAYFKEAFPVPESPLVLSAEHHHDLSLACVEVVARLSNTKHGEKAVASVSLTSEGRLPSHKAKSIQDEVEAMFSVGKEIYQELISSRYITSPKNG